MSDLPTPRTDSAMQAMIDGSGLRAPALVEATKRLREVAQESERRAVIAERKLKMCAGLAEHWRMQASVTSRRSAWSANGALEKCPNQRISQAEKVMTHYPKLWQEWKDIERKKGHSILAMSAKAIEGRAVQDDFIAALDKKQTCSCMGGDDDYDE